MDAPTSSEWRVWWSTPRPARAYTAVLVVLTVVAVARDSLAAGPAHLPRLLALLAAGMVSVELGRIAEGGRYDGQRIHKGLSAWPFAAALVLPGGLAGWVAAAVYTHACLRGIRITRWKWMTSCSIVVASSLAASGVLGALGAAPLPPRGSLGLFATVALALATFLAAESALLAVISRLNREDDERYLRAQLASVSFYAVEAAVLASAVLAVLLLVYSPAFLLFGVPVYALLQRGMLHQPLKDEARHDAKTGVLNWEAWRVSAAASLSQAQRERNPSALLIVDVDHFKSVNDTCGHLAGDDVLAAAADAVVACVRRSDLVGRFGGDEFCALLPSVTPEEARVVAERIRVAVAALPAATGGAPVTASIGLVVARPADGRAELDVETLVGAADRALYAAKRAGRNRVEVLGVQRSDTVGV